jgi:hypothetical protein
MLEIQKYECPICRGPLPIMKNLQKARNLFIKNIEKKDEVSLYSTDDFPALGS